MAGSSEHVNRLPIRDHDDALMPSTGTTGAKANNTNGENRGERPSAFGTPPRKISIARKSSPRNVMDIQRHSFHEGESDPVLDAKMVGSNNNSSGADLSGTADVNNKSLDTSSGNRRMSARSRASKKPERYREQIDEDESPAIPTPTVSTKKASAAIQRKKSATKATASSVSTNAGLSDQKNIIKAVKVKTKPSKKSAIAEGTWTDLEQDQFNQGCIAHGWGNWTNVELCIPTRSKNQVKSHAQKFSKHHPEEKERMIRLFNVNVSTEKSKGRLAPAKNDVAKSNDSLTQPAKTKTTGRKRKGQAKKSLALEPPMKQVKVASKAVRPSKEAEMPASCGGLVKNNPLEAKESKPSNPRKRSNAAAKRFISTKEEKAIVHENNTPSGGTAANQTMTAEPSPPSNVEKAIVNENDSPSRGKSLTQIAAKRTSLRKKAEAIIHDNDAPSGDMSTINSAAKCVPLIKEEEAIVHEENQPTVKHTPSIKVEETNVHENDTSSGGPLKIQTVARRASSRNKEKATDHEHSNPVADELLVQTKKEKTAIHEHSDPVADELSVQTTTMHASKCVPPSEKDETVQTAAKRASPIKNPGAEQPPKKKRGKCLRGNASECDPPLTPGAGEWTQQEKLQFEKGCVLHGWGNWVNVEKAVPSRTNAQIKSHAQKFRKHHPHEKERLEREHEWRCDLKSKLVSADKASVQDKKKSAATTKNGRKSARNRSTVSWSLTERKQFGDGCIMHGWGNWRDVGNHIPTKTISQVRMHSQKYQSEEILMLERKHRRHYLDDDDDDDDDDDEESSVEETSTKSADNAKVCHILLGMGGTPELKSESNSISTEIPSQSNTKRVQSPKVSAQKTTVDDYDYGAAEAMLALNFARWDNRRNSGESEPSTECSGSEPPGLKDTSTAPEDVSVDSQIDGRVIPRPEQIGSKQTSSVASTNIEEVEENTAEDRAVVVPKSDNDVMPVESNNKVEQTSQDSNYSAPTVDLKGNEVLKSLPTAGNLKVGAPAVQRAPTTTNNQPPPHWLAAESWNDCLGNIHRWNELSMEEQNLEYVKYNCFNAIERDRLRNKLVDLMMDPPSIDRL